MIKHFDRTWLMALMISLMAVGCNGGGGSDATNPDPPQKDPPLPIARDRSGIEMVQIPAGSFKMGCRTGREDERPVHEVWVDSFLMDRTEVTQDIFEKIGKNADPPFANPSRFKGADRPVEQVRMDQAALFCNARSMAEGLDPCYNDEVVCDFSKNGYRLPTEAEWEYACRAGTDTDYSFGDNDKLLGAYAWYGGNSKDTHPVGQKKANPWGLYDMHGNVAEWCHDIYDKSYYQASPGKNPRGPAEGKEHVLRGGSWKSTAPMLRTAYRIGENPGFSDACLARDAIGFRCVRKGNGR